MEGPGVIFLFIFTALACSFAAFAYAEFASLIPVSGSAYTYSYVAFGELFAWIIGWALIMEYAIGNVTVAISWSDYFTALVSNVSDYRINEWLCLDYFTAKQNYGLVSALIGSGHTLESIQKGRQHCGSGRRFSCLWFSTAIIWLKNCFRPSCSFINLIITMVVYRGIKESRNAGNVMVFIKVAVVLVVIFVGAFYVDTKNWHPFCQWHGWSFVRHQRGFLCLHRFRRHFYNC